MAVTTGGTFAAPGREERLARGLGWLGVGLGLAETLAPRRIASLVGAPAERRGHPVLRVFGLRGIAAGAALLASPRPSARLLWTRVAGDALDLAALGLVLARPGRRLGRAAAATAAVAGVTALDVFAGLALGRRGGDLGEAGAVRVRKAITVNRSPEEVYRFWRDFRNLSRFMKNVESVEPSGDGRSHWKAKGPAGTTIEWDAEIVNDEPARLLSWRSVGGSVDNAGAVRFERGPGGRGTVVRVDMQYRPPAGAAGAAVAKLFGRDPAAQVLEDLRRVKALLETGEIPTAQGPAARPHPSIFGS